MKQGNTKSDLSSASFMTVDDARRVLWVRPQLRPVGELLDEGIIDGSRLEWAAEYAYNPKLREAAQVILKSMSQTQEESDEKVLHPGISNLASDSVKPPMTLEQARSIRWPFSSGKGQPMGQLLNTGQLTLKDLGFAVEAAYDERVRNAAMTLMLWRLNQVIEGPSHSAGIAKVVSGGRSFSERRQIQYALLQGVIMGFLLGFFSLLMIDAFRQQALRAATDTLSLPDTRIVLISASIFLIASLSGLWALFRGLDFLLSRIDRRMRLHRKGEEGEERVVGIIQHTLDGQWILFRNIELPGRKRTDLDAVLVGPIGVWTLEVKNLSGTYRNIGERWEYLKSNRWRFAKGNPSRQARDNAVRLANFLKADGITQWVEPAVVWANSDETPAIENPSVPVWTMDRLQDELGNLWQNKPMSAENQQKIVEKLTQLCKKQDLDE